MCPGSTIYPSLECLRFRMHRLQKLKQMERLEKLQESGASSFAVCIVWYNCAAPVHVIVACFNPHSGLSLYVNNVVSHIPVFAKYSQGCPISENTYTLEEHN